MRIPTWNPGKDWLTGLADDAMGNMAKAILEALSQMVTTLSTFWVDLPTVNLTDGGDAGASPIVSVVNSELMVWTLSLAVLAVILGGIRMIWEQRGAPLKDLLRSLITLTLVSGLGVSVISIMVVAADAFSVAIIERSTDGKGFAEAMNMLLMMNDVGTAVFILIILGLIGLIASIVQIVLMVVRSGMLVILAGILPTTAAFTNTEMGKQWFQKALGWTIAFILYKPAAAIVYSVAFLLMEGTDQENVSLVGTITGFTLMILALFALPALMRFVTPMVGAVAAGAGGGVAGAAVGAMATGAVSMGRVGSGKGNAAPTPASTQAKSSPSPSSPGAGSGASGATGNGGQSVTGSPGQAGAKGSTGGTAPAASGTPSSTGAATSAKGSSAAGGAVGIAVATGAQVASKASQTAQQTAQDSTGEGPSGSN